MKKSDVKLSYHQGARGLPMVNVKVDQCNLTETAAKYAEEFSDALFPAWLAENYDRDIVQEGAWDAAIEHGWNVLQDDAQNVFGDVSSRVKIYAEGRSGGWCVVDGLPHVETWDAILVGKWARFAKYARQAADDIPYLMVHFLYYHPFAQYREQVDADMARCARDAGVVEKG